MSRDRGYIDRRRKLRGLPFVVEVPRPDGGAWRTLDDMNAWCLARCGNAGYLTTSRQDRSGPGLPNQIMLVHFADDAVAEAFAREFGLPPPSTAR
jgi:hypothetical protein